MTKLTIAVVCMTLGLVLLASQLVHSAPQDAESEIRARIVARFAAMERRDFDAYERFLADSYVRTDEDGAVADKKAAVADARTDYAPGRNTKYEVPSEFRVQFYGSAAIASYRVLVHEIFDAQVLSTDYRKCETYVKQGGAWKLVALAQQRIPNTSRVPAKIDPAGYDDYVGDYEVGPHFIVYIRRDGNRLMESASDDPKPVEDLPYSKERFFQRGVSGQDVFLRNASGKVTAVVWEAPNGDVIAHRIK
jgi:ketosteroid isomerase-like protein